MNSVRIFSVSSSTFREELPLFGRFSRRNQLPCLPGLLDSVQELPGPLRPAPHTSVLLGNLRVAALVGVDTWVRELLRKRLVAGERLLG